MYLKFIFCLLTAVIYQNISAQTLIFEDNFNGNNTIPALQARGWTIFDEDGGGTSPTWFQGNPNAFSSLEGPDSGYVASNFNGRNSFGVIDHWLITPAFNLVAGDSIIFWARTASGLFNDSISVYFSTVPNPTTADFTMISGFPFTILDVNWQPFIITVFAASTFQISIRYNMTDAGNTADFIGIDHFQVYSNAIQYPASISLNKSFTFNDPTRQSSYRMIGVPGNVNIPVGPLMNGEQNKDWNVFYDGGSEPVDLLEFNGQATFNFRPGKGFWALSRNPINIPQQNVNSVTLQNDNTFQMNLNPGWNIISNPFERSVNWIDVQNINGITQPLHSFEGQYSPSNVMETYKGYYYFNADSRGSISIPYNPGGALGKNKITEVGGVDYGDLKNDLEISLVIENKKKSAAFVSINPDSRKEYDKYDIFAPPGNFEEAKISIFNELLPSYKYLMTDSRNEIGEGQSYDVKVKNSTGKICFINIEGLENFGSNEIYLFDSRLRKSYNLKLQNKIEVSPLHENNDFQLLIGSESFINNMKISQTPDEYMLYQNYPNPFNPSTIITFDLPRNQNIKLIIYNVLGERVKSIFSGYLEAGRYEFTWNGANDLNVNLPTGVYIYSIEGPDFKSAKKMILNR